MKTFKRMKQLEEKKYKAIFRDKNKNYLWEKDFTAYNIKKAREYAKLILATTSDESKSVIVIRIY